MAVWIFKYNPDNYHLGDRLADPPAAFGRGQQHDACLARARVPGDDQGVRSSGPGDEGPGRGPLRGER
jgi:hypothetical protein